MIYNRIPVEIGPDRRVTTQPINYQYDVRQILVISGAEGVELPAFFTVDFCNVGDADTQPIAGSASGVMIPDSLLQTGKNIMAYFVIAGPDTAVQTRYEITIPVNARPEGTDIDPDEDQQRQIDALIETLNEGVEAAEDAAEAIQNMGVEAETLTPGSPLTVTKEVDPETGAVTLIFGLTQGPKGDDGYSPTITITEITGGHRFTVTDKTHPSGQSFDVLDGTKGDQGDDGYSPVVTIATITGGHRVTITDKTHPSGQSFDVMDGASDAGQVSYDATQTYQNGTVGKELSDQKNAISELNRQLNHFDDNLPGTVQTVNFGADGKPSSVVHTKNGVTVRTDAYTWGDGTVTETRTTADGSYITMVTDLSTLVTTISEIQEAS